MALDLAQRTVLNAALAERLGVAPGADYTASRSAFAAVLGQLQAEGWRLRTQDGSAARANWEAETHLMLERRSVLRITRSAEHQAAAEAAGEVRPGENTYESVLVEQRKFSLASFVRDAQGVQSAVSSIVEAAALAGLRAPPKHPDFLRDG